MNISSTEISNKNITAIYSWQNDDYAKLWQLYQSQTHLPHSILLYGMDGLGISTFGAYWIKSILCNAPIGDRACENCQSCVLIADNSHPDIYTLIPDPEIEVKNKTISIASVREAINFIALSPHLAKYKIVFIPDFNLLTLSSANAILKILEEPPAYTLFVLVSTNIGLVLPTIKSRCHKFMLSRPRLNSHLISDVIKGDKSTAFWLAYYDTCPVFKPPITEDELQICIAALITPSIDNIFALTGIIDGKIVKFSFALDFLQKWLSDIVLYKLTQRLNYFYYFETQIAQIMPNLHLAQVFYLSDKVSSLTKWAEHPLNQKLQLDNLMLHYQQLFVKVTTKND